MNDKRDRIIQTAIALFAGEGVGVPIVRLAKQAAVSEDALFEHFETKRALIDTVYTGIKSEMAEVMFIDFERAESAKDAFSALWESCIRWGVRNAQKRKVARHLKDAGAVSGQALDAAGALFAPARDRITAAIESGEIRDLPADYVLRLCVAEMGAVIDHADAAELDSVGLDMLVVSGFDVFWNGIKA